ncbi:Primosomal protein N' [bacterium HR33]|nr:Primosomal protein N' [bacterium HR33]
MAPRVGAAVCEVALPLPSDRLYRYLLPEDLSDRAAPGMRVLVPVRTGEMVGVVMRLDRADEGESLRPLLLFPDPEPVVPGDLMQLAEWMAGYYVTPIGLVLRAMLPSGLWGRSRLVAHLVEGAPALSGSAGELLSALRRMGGRATAARLSRELDRPVWDLLRRAEQAGALSLEVSPARLGIAPKTEKTVRLIRYLPSLLEREQVFGRALRQRELYETIDALGGEATVSHLVRQLGFSSALVRGLVRRGVAVYGERRVVRDPFAGVPEAAPPEPTAQQREALAKLIGMPPGGAALLFGVTGSGKTLVYLEALRRELEEGRGAIVLVPEIALTAQTVARVRGVFGDTVAVLHSGLSEAERVDAWYAVASGRRKVVVGARSAVFAPVAKLGALVVDEEHDPSYKNGEAPRYHARDVALRRARLAGARVILGSATPSLEVWAVRDKITLVRLPQRVQAPGLPQVKIVDLRIAPLAVGSGGVPWSLELDRSVEERLRSGEQVILLLNRRGFANFLQCLKCGDVAQCPSCSIALTVHRTPAALKCHYCGHQEALPERCRICGGETQRTRGVGTQALERWLAERFSGARLARMDADTTTGKWSHGRILERVARGEVDLLFGTQMIAKGLDFPNVTLVGVIDADTSLHLPDFRAAERTFQLVAQVAGRAGRGPKGGEVLIQTRHPHHYAIEAVAAHDFEAFAQRELEVRRTPPYPPHVALANVVVSGLDERRVGEAAVELAGWFRRLIAVRAPGQGEVVGPAPAPLARIKQRWRWHLLLRSADREWLGRVVGYAARRAPYASRRGGPVRVIFDRDPVSLL